MKTPQPRFRFRPNFRFARHFIVALVLMLGGNFAVTVPAEAAAEVAKPEEEALRKMQRKLKEIVIPTVDFKDATIKDAINFLRIRSVELDGVEEDPALKGVNVILLPNPDWDGIRITLNLKAIPLGHALKFVAELAGGEVRVDPNAVVISKKS